MKKELSIIIPFGIGEETPWIAERIWDKVEFYRNYPNLEVIFCEGFSSVSNTQLKDYIRDNGLKYIKDTSQIKFSQGQCRNLGARFATSGVITFMDADCCITEHGIDKLLDIIKIKEIEKNTNSFVTLPVIYLSKEGTDKIRKVNKDRWDTILQHDILTGQNLYSRFLALCSSTVVLNRHKFLELGGNDNAFIGHGYEDFDFYYRFLKSCANFEKLPSHLNFDSKNWNIKKFKGFRSLFTIPTYECISYGLYLYHLYHDNVVTNAYQVNKESNKKLFFERIKNFKTIHDSIDPLNASILPKKNNIIFTKKMSPTMRSLRGLRCYIGDIYPLDEDYFFEKDIFNSQKFLNFLKTNIINSVIFPNPYANSKRLRIYNFARENGIKYYCYDRGALPDSWFLDSRGFNYDSSSYKEENWNIELTPKEMSETEGYIDEIINGNNYLENQGEKQTIQELEQMLGIEGKRVVFVPLQVEGDTVIKYFTRPSIPYGNFLELLDKVGEKIIKDNWVIVAKKHPLSKDIETTSYKNIVFTNHSTNIDSLLDLATLVVTINSGVGLLAMLHKKPVLLAGNAFYHIPGVNYNFNSERELLDLIYASELKVDYIKIVRFINYLRNKFYLFGTSTYKFIQKKERDFSIVQYIDFYRIIIDGVIKLNSGYAKQIEFKKNHIGYKQYNYIFKKPWIINIFSKFKRKIKAVLKRNPA